MIEDFALIIALLVVLFFVYYFIKFILFLATDREYSPVSLWSSFEKRMAYSKVRDRFDKILVSNNFEYYKNLNIDSKNDFLMRVVSFVYNKQFNGCEGHVVTLEQKILISATAIKLSFGLDKYIIPNFAVINIYPKEYFSKYSRKYHKGDTNLNGFVNLSYQDFVGGYSDPDDGINLGIHELAHAFNFDRLMLNRENDYFSEYYKRWFKMAKEEMAELMQRQVHFFRKYAGNNIHEFFAVSLENFFERPLLFHQEMPALYKKMSLMLNQDPLQKEDPRIRKSSNFKAKNDTPINLNYSSRIDVFKLVLSSFYLVFYLFLGVILMQTGNGFFMVFIVFIVLVISLINLSSHRKFEVYDNMLCVESYYFKNFRKLRFGYNDIFSVQFGDKKSSSIILKYFVNNTIKSKVLPWSSSDDDCQVFMQKLLEKNVRVQITKQMIS
jgi:Mlc titration factor MtfA (ptsG expression regulator)